MGQVGRNESHWFSFIHDECQSKYFNPLPSMVSLTFIVDLWGFRRRMRIYMDLDFHARYKGSVKMDPIYSSKNSWVEMWVTVHHLSKKNLNKNIPSIAICRKGLHEFSYVQIERGGVNSEQSRRHELSRNTRKQNTGQKSRTAALKLLNAFIA